MCATVPISTTIFSWPHKHTKLIGVFLWCFRSLINNKSIKSVKHKCLLPNIKIWLSALFKKFCNLCNWSKLKKKKNYSQRIILLIFWLVSHMLHKLRGCSLMNADQTSGCCLPAPPNVCLVSFYTFSWYLLRYLD